MPKRTFKVGKEIYDIEESDVNDFLNDMPNAIEVKSFKVDKDTFDIELTDVDEFLKDMPNAVPLHDGAVKKKDPTPQDFRASARNFLSGSELRTATPSPLLTGAGGSSSTPTKSESNKSPLEGIKGSPTVQGKQPKQTENPLLKIKTELPSEKPAFNDRLNESLEIEQRLLNDPTFTLLTASNFENLSKRAKVFEEQNKAIAKERGYNSVDELYNDMDEYLSDFLPEGGKQEFMYLRSRKDLLDQIKKAKAAGQPTENLEKKYQELLSGYAQSKAQKIAQADAGIKQLRMQLEGNPDPETKTAILNEIKLLEASKQPFFKAPQKTAEQVVTEFGLEGKESAQEKVRKYAHSLMRERSALKDALGIKGEINFMQALAQNTIQGDNPYVQRLIEVEKALGTVAPVALLNETPITERESAWGVLGKSAIQSLSPRTEANMPTQLQMAQTVQTALELTGTQDKVNKDVIETLDLVGKPYENWSANQIASMTGTTVGFIPKFMVASALVETGLGAFAVTSPYWRAVGTLAEKGKLAGTAEGTLLNAMSANRYGRGLLRTAFKGLEFGVQSEVESQIFAADKDEVGFVTGLAGGGAGVVGGKAFQLVGSQFAKGITALFGKQAPEVTSKIMAMAKSAYGKGAAMNETAIGEMFEELGEELGNTWRQSENGREFMANVSERFGEPSEALNFFLSTYMMGLAFGLGTQIGKSSTDKSAKAYENLSTADKSIADQVISDLKKEQVGAELDAAKELINKSDLTENEKQSEIDKLDEQANKINEVIDGEKTAQELGEELQPEITEMIQKLESLKIDEKAETEKTESGLLDSETTPTTDGDAPTATETTDAVQTDVEIVPPASKQEAADIGGVTPPNVSLTNEGNKVEGVDNKGVDATENALEGLLGKKEEVADAPPAVDGGQVSGEVKAKPDALQSPEATAKALEGVDKKSNKSLWDKIKDLVNKISQKLGGISDNQHINDFKKAKTEWSKLSRKEKQLKRADYELDGLLPSEGGYYKVGDVLFDLDLSENIFSLLISGKKLLSILPKLGVTTFNAENRPAEEMFAHYSDGKIHLNNNSDYENIRQLTRAITHELGHHEFTKLSEKEKDYVNSLSIETAMALQYKAQGDGKQTSASLEEENFADYVMQYFQGKLYGDETLLNKIPEKLRKIFDDKYSNLLNENNDISEAYHKAKADGSNPELVKAVEGLLGKPAKQELETQEKGGNQGEIKSKEAPSAGGEVFTESSPPAGVEQTGYQDVDAAQTAEDLAILYGEEARNPTEIDAREQAISNVIGTVSKESWNRFGDKNKIGASMAKTYFGDKKRQQDAQTIDQIAMEASMAMFGEDNPNEITTDDVVAFIEKYPNGYNPSAPSGNPKLKAIASKYFAIAGKNINKRVAKQIAEKVKANEKKMQSIEVDVRSAAELAGSVEAIASYIDDEGFWTVFPGGMTKDEYNQLKQAYNELTDEQKQEIQNQLSGIDEDVDSGSDDIGDAEIKQEPETTTKEQLQSNLDEAKKEYNRAENDYQKAKDSFEKARKESQIDLMGRAKQDELLFKTDLKALNQRVQDLKAKRDAAKEAVDKAQQKLDDFVPPNQMQMFRDDTVVSDDNFITDMDEGIIGEPKTEYSKKELAKSPQTLIDVLEGMKVGTKGKAFDAILGIPIGMWNASIDGVIAAIKAGKTISEAIDAGIEKARTWSKNAKKPFNEDAYRERLEVELGVNTKIEKGKDFANTASKGKSIDQVLKKPNAAPEPMRIHQAIKKVLENIGVPVAEKYLPKKYLGIFKHRSKSVRVQSLFDIFTACHEAAHYISREFGIGERIRDKGAVANLNPQKAKNKLLRKKLTDIYVEFYPSAKADHKLETRIEEGIAVLLENYLYDPSYINQKYPELVDEFINPAGDYYHPKFTELLEELNKVIQDYSNLTPSQKIGSRIARGEEVVKQREGFSFAQKLVFEMMSKSEPLKRADDMAMAGLTQESVEIAHRRWLTRSSIITPWVNDKHAMMYMGNGRWEQVDTTVKNYLDKIKGKEVEFDEYLVARRALGDVNYLTEMENELTALVAGIDPDLGPTQEEKREIKDLSERIMLQRQVVQNDDFDIQVAAEVVRQYQNEFKEAVAIYDAINQNMVEFAAVSGLISQDKAQKYKENKTYSSFKRLIIDDLMGKVAPTGSNSQKKVTSFKSRTGSTKTIISPVYNQTWYIAEVINKSMQNNVWQKLADISNKNTDLARLFEKVETQRAVDQATGKLSYPQLSDPNLIAVWNGGVPTFYKAAPEYLAVAESMTPRDFELFAALMGYASRIFSRLTTTANPFFPLVNVPIDTVSAWLNTKTGFKPIVSQLATVKDMAAYVADYFGALEKLNKWWENIRGKKISTLPQEDMTLFEKYLALGGSGQTLAAYYDLTPDELIAAARGDNKVVSALKRVDQFTLRLLEIPSNMSEYMTRFAEFKRAKQQGATDDVAMYMASEVSVPFIQQGRLGGRFGQSLVRSIPYFNATLQVLGKFARTASEDPIRTAAISAGVIAIQVGLILLAIKDGDDEDIKVLREMSPEDLAKGFMIPNKIFGGDGFTRIRTLEQIGFMGAIAQMAILSQKEGIKYTASDYAKAITTPIPSQFNVLEPEQVIWSWMPQIVKPSFEVMNNKQTFPEVRPIVPYGLSRKVNELQYTQYTTETSKFIGKLTNTSPMLVDHWLKAQFGRVPNMLIQKAEAGFSPEKDYSMIKKTLFKEAEDFVLRGRTLNDFYSQLEYWEKVNNSWKDMYRKEMIDEQTAEDMSQNAKVMLKTDELINMMRQYIKADGSLDPKIQQDLYEYLKKVNNSPNPMQYADDLVELANKFEESVAKAKK